MKRPKWCFPATAAQESLPQLRLYRLSPQLALISGLTRILPSFWQDEAPRQPHAGVDLPQLDYRGLFDASPNPYLVLDRRLYIVGANKAYLAATKRQLADIVGRWAWDAFPTDPETLRLAIASFERVMRTKEPDTLALLRFDIPRPAEEGGGFETRYWSIVAAPVLDQAGEVQWMLQHPIDVTELQRLREAAAQAEERPLPLMPALTGLVDRAQNVHETNLALRDYSDRLRELFEQAPSPITVLAGPSHVFDLANEAFYRLIGRRDIVGKPLLEAVPELAGQGFDLLLDEVFRSGQPFVGHGLKVSLRQQPNAPLADIYHDVLYQPLLGPHGKVKGIFCQLNEVTEAYRAQAALRESERRLALALAASSSAVRELDVPSGVIHGEELLFSMLGYAPGELPNMADWLAIMHPEDSAGISDLIGETIAGRRDKYHFEGRLRTRDGAWRWNLSQAVVAERDSAGVALRLVGTHTDITRRKEADAEIQRLNAQLEQRVADRTAELQRANEALLHTNMELQHFAHAVAHDLQTPLRSIASFSELLQRATAGFGDEQIDHWSSLVIDNTRRLQALIQELLAYTRLDIQGLPFEAVNLRAVFDEVSVSLSVLVQETRAEVRCGPLPTLPADRIQMAQVLQNLIENGIKYNHSKPPRVSIASERHERDWVLSVADNGIGIDPRHHERIFEIFRRLHAWHEVPGSGIGLALCRRIVERHGGKIWVESRSGEGSTFYFTLPDR